ncbi:MAG TPA: hypothetical protein VHZ95_04835, partial [Polyangiales bacterium]|nr:hypothetical protein [Polyangiales bacterium]
MNAVGLVLILLLSACGATEHHLLEDQPSASSAQDASPSDAIPDAGLDASSPHDAQVDGADRDSGHDASKSTGSTSHQGAGDGGIAPILPVPDAGSKGRAADDDDAGAAISLDTVDLLFVVDNSNSMAEKQASLKAALPSLMHALTSGTRSSGGSALPAVTDLHVGVVSTDMGTPGVSLPGCDPNGGDDGRLRHEPHGADCQ